MHKLRHSLSALLAFSAVSVRAEAPLSPRQPYPPTSRPPYELRRPTLPPPPPAARAAQPETPLSGYIVFVAGAFLLFRKPD